MVISSFHLPFGYSSILPLFDSPALVFSLLRRESQQVDVFDDCRVRLGAGKRLGATLKQVMFVFRTFVLHVFLSLALGSPRVQFTYHRRVIHLSGEYS